MIVTSRDPSLSIGGDVARLHNLIHFFPSGCVTVFAVGSRSRNVGWVGGSKLVVFRRGWTDIIRGFADVVWGRSSLSGALFFCECLNKELVRTFPGFSHVIFHLVRTSSAWRSIDEFGGSPSVTLEMADLMSLNYRVASRQLILKSRWLLACVYAVESYLIRRVEVHSSGIFSKISLHATRDLLNARLLNTGFFIAKQPRRLQPIAFDSLRSIPRHIVFVGKTSYLPNELGLDWFFSRVLPLMPFRGTLSVLGSSSGYTEYRHNWKIVYHNFIDDLDTFLATCSAGICPITHATGVQNKILDYLSVGLPVVSTEAGALGLVDDVRNAIKVQSDPSRFCESLVGVVEWNKSERESFFYKARGLIKAHYDFETIREDYLATLQYYD